MTLLGGLQLQPSFFAVAKMNL